VDLAGRRVPSEESVLTVFKAETMPTRDPISAPNVRAVAVVVDPSKYDTCNSARSSSSTQIDERPVYIIDSTRSAEDDQSESGDYVPCRRGAANDITAVRIPTYLSHCDSADN
jgi:hypothetical protein